MAFEELQTIWDSQNDEIYAINRDALYAQIKRKGQSVSRKLDLVELLMFVGNFIVSIILFINARQDDGQVYHYILPIMYSVYSVGVVVFRRMRQKEEVHFELTILGELNKALWQINYLIKQARTMMVWYALPLLLVLSVTLVLDSKLPWALAVALIVAPLTYFGGRWEINRWYLPKKRELESLREYLISQQLE